MLYLLQAETPWFQTQLFAGIFAAIIGALVAWLTSLMIENNKAKRSKKDLVFEFHREFNNTEMSKNRRTANASLVSFAKINGYTELHSQKNLLEELTKSPNDDILSLYAVMRFFQRLAIAHYNRYLDRGLLKDLFQELFYYWYYNVFITLNEENPPEKTDREKNFSEWQTLHRDVERLANCFKNCIIKNSSKNDRLIADARLRFTNYLNRENVKGL